MESPAKNPLDIVKGSEQEIGPLLGIFTIIILVVVGALYFWTHEPNRIQKNSTNATTTEIIIRRHSPASTSTSESAASSTGNPRAVRAEQSSHDGNTELDAIENGLEDQTENVNGLNF